MKVPPLKIVFSEQDRQEILRRVDQALAGGQVAQGQNVKEFEEAFAKYVGVKHAVAVSSGGAALEVGMRLLGVTGKEVLVPTNTFAASATGVLLAGGKVRFADADPKTLCVSLASLKAAATPQTSGVIVVHIGGIIPPEIEQIRAWCDSRGIWLFEDAAHAHGSELGGKRAGRFGKAAAYSFFATKVMTSGEGGMLATDDDKLAERARGLRDYGKPDPWVSFHAEIGSNWRMAEFCAAVGVVHLRRLDEFIAWRQKIADLYDRLLPAIPELTVIRPVGRTSGYKKIALLPAGVPRDAIKSALKEKGVGLPGGVYETPLHRQPVFEKTAQGSFPAADDVCARHICLPLYYGMTDDEARYVVEALRTVLSEKGVRA